MKNPDRPSPPIHDGAEFVDLPADPSPLDYVSAGSYLMARFMNRYWDCCQKERKPLLHSIRFRVEPGRVVCEGKIYGA